MTLYHIPSVVNQPPFGLSINTLMGKVESIQYQAALACTGAWKGSSRIKLYEELGWESLSDRRMCRRVLQVHKIVDNKTPTYLRGKLPPTRRNLINLPNIFKTIRGRTDRYLNSFFPDATSTWNNIVSNFENLPTFDGLKDHIISLIRPEAKSMFGLHDPSNLRYIFQLRVGLSHLRSHKKRHNFIDTPSDFCLCKQGVEDTRHFFLTCPFYDTPREVLENKVHEILQKNNLNYFGNYAELYLYGNSSLNPSNNQEILSATIEFIISTNRFSI